MSSSVQEPPAPVEPSHETSSTSSGAQEPPAPVDPSHATSNTSSGAQEPPAPAVTATVKKNTSTLGPEERKLKRKAAEDRSAKLSLDIDKLLAQIDILYDKCAEENGVTLARVKKLAHQAPGMKPQRKTSDFNICVYFKRKELNECMFFLFSCCLPNTYLISDFLALEPGDKLKLTDIQAAVKEDEDLQQVLNDKKAMAELRKRFDEEKSKESVAAVRVSKRAEAKTVAEKLNLLQQEVCFSALSY